MVDRIAIIKSGAYWCQTGTPEEVYQRPRAPPIFAGFMEADNKIISGEFIRFHRNIQVILPLSRVTTLFIFAAPMRITRSELTQPTPQEGLALEGVLERKRVS
ncbi:hypothetical protein MJ588_02380 [Klebsiella pneumoniae]|nr:hypothetical protein MJ588_02380 [Klebsiella pneumoniae]